MTSERRDLPTAAGQVAGHFLSYIRRIPRLFEALRAVLVLALPKRMRALPVAWIDRAAAGWTAAGKAAEATAKENEDP